MWKTVKQVGFAVFSFNDKIVVNNQSVLTWLILCIILKLMMQNKGFKTSDFEKGCIRMPPKQDWRYCRIRFWRTILSFALSVKRKRLSMPCIYRFLLWMRKRKAHKKSWWKMNYYKSQTHRRRACYLKSVCSSAFFRWIWMKCCERKENIELKKIYILLDYKTENEKWKTKY